METQSPLNKSTKESGLCVGPVMVNKIRRYMKTYDRQKTERCDESKVKTACVRPVNRTMSYEDRIGYVCTHVCMWSKMVATVETR